PDLGPYRTAPERSARRLSATPPPRGLVLRCAARLQWPPDPNRLPRLGRHRGGSPQSPGPRSRNRGRRRSDPRYRLSRLRSMRPRPRCRPSSGTPRWPPPLRERGGSLPPSAFDGAGLFQPEGPVDDLNREGVERVLDELTRPSRRVDVRRPERFREGPDILLRNGASFCQVPLVHDEKYRHVPHNLECRRNPVVQGVQAVLARQVADAHQGLGTVVVRLSHEVPESPLAHDIKNRHADLDLDVRAVRDGEFDLAHLRADRMQVRVLVLVQDEPSDQRSLPD